MNTLLLIEDDRKLHELLRDYLELFGFELHATDSPEEGLQMVRTLRPDLVLLDVMLPGMNGFEVCRRIRQDSDIPVIMLTARGDVSDRVAGLELGADDYIQKPFESRELVARIQTVLRRMGRRQESAEQQYGRLVVDFDARSARLDGTDLGLTTNEFNALALLVRNPGKVQDRDALLHELRGLDSDNFNRSVDITMSRLRHKLQDDPKSPEFIKTIWGAGYMFIHRADSDE